jgi:hypothetical protein
MSQTKVCEEKPRGLVVRAWCPIITTASSGPPCALAIDGSASTRARSAIGRTSTPSGIRSRSTLVPTMCQSPTEMRSTPASRSAFTATNTSSVISLRPRA